MCHSAGARLRLAGVTDYLTNLEGYSFLNEKIPGINVSVADQERKRPD
jgi:hypothetical protein